MLILFELISSYILLKINWPIIAMTFVSEDIIVIYLATAASYALINLHCVRDVCMAASS